MAAAAAVQDEGPKKEAWSFVQLGQHWAEHPVALSIEIRIKTHFWCLIIPHVIYVI